MRKKTHKISLADFTKAQGTSVAHTTMLYLGKAHLISYHVVHTGLSQDNYLERNCQQDLLFRLKFHLLGGRLEQGLLNSWLLFV